MRTKLAAGERLLAGLPGAALPPETVDARQLPRLCPIEPALRAPFRNQYQAVPARAQTSQPCVPLGTDARGNLTRLDNALDNFPERIEKAENYLGTLIQQRDAAQAELGKPFPQEEELAAKSARLAELDALLNMEDSPGQEAPVEGKTEAKEESRKPSVLAELKVAAASKPSVTKSKTCEKEAETRQ